MRFRRSTITQFLVAKIKLPSRGGSYRKAYALIQPRPLFAPAYPAASVNARLRRCSSRGSPGRPGGRFDHHLHRGIDVGAQWAGWTRRAAATCHGICGCGRTFISAARDGARCSLQTPIFMMFDAAPARRMRAVHAALHRAAHLQRGEDCVG